MTELEQNLLFAATGVVLVGTLIVFVWQYIRMNRRDKDDVTDRPPLRVSAARLARLGRTTRAPGPESRPEPDRPVGERVRTRGLARNRLGSTESRARVGDAYCGCEPQVVEVDRGEPLQALGLDGGLRAGLAVDDHGDGDGLGALAPQRLDRLQRRLTRGRGVFDHDDALARDIRPLDLAPATVVLRLLAHDERVERVIGARRTRA